MRFKTGEKIFIYGDKKEKFFGNVVEFLGETHIDGAVYLIEINGKKISMHESYIHFV
jgi:hypothetical protein